ncbi:MAG: molybdopterin molybdotransferase MoeA [Halobacteriota archaeon]|nr:molybdopterin molybdotransferase MoeA [Halobacteriota archaeon]
MGEFSDRTSVDDALTIILSKAKTAEEKLSFEKCLGMVLAEDVVSGVDLPPFDRAAMDGYAIRGEDSFGASQTNPLRLRIIGESRIGEFSDADVGEFEAVRIATGAPIPPGSNAVMMVEYTRELDGIVEVFKPVTPGRNVSSRGEDIRTGDLVLKRGRMLKPHDIGVLAALGKSEVKVFKKPDVAIISTGDELIEVGEDIPGKIVDVNSYTLKAMTSSFGVPTRLKIVKDDPELLKETISSCLTYDLILISGGTSVGKKDFLPMILKEMGEILFHGVSMRPGQPTGFGMVYKTPIFMLPGFPVAAMVAFEILVRPFLQKSMGLSVSSPYPHITATLRRKIASEIGRRDFVRVGIKREGEKTSVEPITSSGSGILSSMVEADGFLIVPESREGFEEGEEVCVSLYL